MLDKTAEIGGVIPRYILVLDSLVPGCDGISDSTTVLRHSAFDTTLMSSPLAGLCANVNALLVECVAKIYKIDKCCVVQFGADTVKMVNSTGFIK